MSRTQIACYALLASAFALGGLLCLQLDSRLATPAQGDMVISRESFTLMTALTRNGEEALFVLENRAQRLLIYTVDLPKGRLEPVGSADLAMIFGRGGAGAGGAGGAGGLVPGGRVDR